MGQDYQSQIDLAKQELKELHKQARDLIYNRPDVTEPLNFSARDLLAKLDARYTELEGKIARLEMRIRIEEGDVKFVLTDNELKILGYLANRKDPDGLTMIEIAENSHKPRGVVYDNLRKFILAGFVLHQHKRYQVTLKGIHFYHKQQELNENQRHTKTKA